MTLKKILSMSVPQADGCILFAPGKYPHNRYGCVAIQTGLAGTRKMGAHRAVWILSRGEAPDGMEVCHKCDSPRCVNVEHLFLGTHLENMQDRDAKGRNGTLGENSPLHKLSRLEVLKIRGCIGLGMNLGVIAEEFSISKTTVKRIRDGETWKHLTPATA